MKIYTKTGDSGQTSLIGGTRVPKHHIRIEAYGTTDELNSYLGLLGEYAETKDFLPLIRNIQDTLFVMGSHLANDAEKSHFSPTAITEAEVQLLETSIDKMDTELPALKNFILSGGCAANATAHIARCVCRRAERCVVHLNEHETVSPIILHYLNRLSDWLFTVARYASYLSKSEEIVWKTR